MWTIVVVVLLISSVTAQQNSSAALRCQTEGCQYIGYKHELGHIYKVEGQRIRVIVDNLTLTIDCFGAGVLDSSALPSAALELRVTHLKLSYCPPPRTGSLRDTLTALNVTLLLGTRGQERSALILDNLPVAPPLAARHFRGLERLAYLDVFAKASARVSPASGFLVPLRELRALSLWNVELAAGDLATVPASLLTLAHSSARVAQLPAAVHAAPALHDLTINSVRALDAVQVPPALQELKLDSPATTLRLHEAPSLQTLSITHWTEKTPPAVSRCDSLREVHLEAPAITALPPGWLSNCSQLEKLTILHAGRLTDLPRTLFLGTSALTHLTLSWGQLETLPAGLFDDLNNLQMLVLNDNKLQMIPSDMFSAARQVRVLDLSSNKLKSGALDALAPLEQLTELNLANNPPLGDLCAPAGESPLRNLTKLTKLSLFESSVSRVCRDWRRNMPRLEMLDLGRTKISLLSLEDLLFRRDVKAQVWLADTPVVAVQTSREEFDSAASAEPGGARIYLRRGTEPGQLACDCRMYWTRRALERHLHVFDVVNELQCADGRPLRALAPEDMVCARPEECAAGALPAACTCAVRPDDDPRRERLLVRVTCTRVALRHVPRPLARPASTERFYELLLPDNNITDLHADDLLHVKGLDLRDNSLRRVDEVTATRLGRMSGSVWLAGNPLECTCEAASLLRALHARAPADTDLGEARCADGGALYAASTEPCLAAFAGMSTLAWLGGALAVLFALALIISVCLASPERRFFLKAVLHRWGCAWRAADPREDAALRYDAFLTFSHRDEAVACEVLARLEPRYRLCVHYRDWIPGHMIPEQITQSVRESRRTIALVSRHFLASSWARAEFREAHAAAMQDARPRLVLVLLEEPAVLPLDDLLQRYLKTTTYVRWGDPWFWDKLQVALPPPREKPASDSPFIAALTPSAETRAPAP